MLKMSWKLFVITFSVIYIGITLFSIYRLYHISNHSGLGHKTEDNLEKTPEPKATLRLHKDTSNIIQQKREVKTVEIWGKAAIGLYLWKHVLNGEVKEMNAGLIQHGTLERGNLRFIFRSGPGIIPTTVPSNVQFLVLVLNGRSEEKIEAAKLWLDYLPLYVNLKRVAILILGDEQCNNKWLLPHMKSKGGKVDLVFMVYDSPLVDNKEFYQWPLGVATYRGFPNISPEQVDVSSARSHLCNFLGTIHNTSSRPELINQAANMKDKCIIVGRNRWIPYETEGSLNMYIKSILKSDLTLSPVGKNTECYRIYEAMSLGSVPVIEDQLTPGNCDATSSNSPLRLLKSHNAPVIYITDWKKLPQLLTEEESLTLKEKVKRRTAVVEWYTNFKRTLADHFVNVISSKFFY